MKDEMTIGSSPINEDCAQVGSKDYATRAKKECKVYLNQLIRTHGAPPTGAFLAIKGFGHDFGTYYEVVVIYDEEIEKAVDYAFLLEGNAPENWDNISLQELKQTA